MIRKSIERVAVLIEAGKFAGNADPSADTAAAGTLVVDTIEDLVMPQLLDTDATNMGIKAMEFFPTYRRSIGHRS